MAASVTEEARKQANLRLLQRSIDKNIVDIVGSATHVVLYEYMHPQGWEKSQVEGSLFLVAQQPQTPQQQQLQYALAILNRHSTENFQVAVTRDFQLQHKEPYLIFKQAHKILGIWFHNANERVVMASLLNQVIYNLQNNITATAPPPAPTPEPQQPPPPVPNAWGPGGVAARGGASPMAQLLQSPPPATAAASRPPAAHADSPSQLIEPLMNSLLSPMVDAAHAQQQHQQQASPLPPRQQSSGGGSGSSTPSKQPPGAGVALDKKSLQLALLSLIQDERFIDLLHAQYLKVAHARANRNNKK